MRRFPPQVIGRALELFYRGRSLRETGKIIEGEFGDAYAGISPQTVSNWVTWGAQAATAELVGKRAATGVSWVAYLVLLKYGPRWWLVRDGETGYIISSQVAWGKQTVDPQSVVEKALASAIRPCEVLTYKRIEDYEYSGLRDTLDDSVATGFRDALSSYAPACTLAASDMENVEVDEDRFVKHVRAMVKKYSWTKNEDVLNTYLNGWAISYNFFPGTLVDSNHTPGQKAQVVVPFKTWEDVVRQAYRWSLRRAAAEKSDLP